MEVRLKPEPPFHPPVKTRGLSRLFLVAACALGGGGDDGAEFGFGGGELH